MEPSFPLLMICKGGNFCSWCKRLWLEIITITFWRGLRKIFWEKGQWIWAISVVSLTEINKKTILAFFVFHQEKSEVLLFLLAPLGLWTLRYLIWLRWVLPRNTAAKKKNEKDYKFQKQWQQKNLNIITITKTNHGSTATDFTPLFSVLRIGWRIAWINLPKHQNEYVTMCHVEQETSPPHYTEHTHMYVVFENCTLEIKDEMSAELFFCAGVEIEDIDCGALDPITFHQLVTNILPRHKNTDEDHFVAMQPSLLHPKFCMPSFILSHTAHIIIW